MSTFKFYAQVYDLLYRDKDYAAECRYVLSLLDAHGRTASRILDVGCGTGAHAEQFARLGHEVFGVDHSADMLVQAERRRLAMPENLRTRLKFETGDLRELDLGQKFDTVTALFHVMSYQAGEGDLEAAIAALGRHLESGGVLVFDFWYGPGVQADPPSVRERQAGDGAISVRRIAQPRLDSRRHQVEVEFTLQVRERETGVVNEFHETHAMRYFFPTELEALLSEQGLTVRSVRGWMSDTEPTSGDWYACMVAEKH